MALVIVILYNLVRVYSFVLFVFAVMSWFPGAYQTPFGRLVVRIVEPVIKPFSRISPQFSVIIVIFLLNFLMRLLSYIVARFM